jgi:geranylgeranyl pyrophosphate synthase
MRSGTTPVARGGIALSTTPRATEKRLLDKPSPMISSGIVNDWLPLDGRLKSLLEVNAQVATENVLREALMDPIRQVVSNPGKGIRARLVALAYRLLGDNARSCPLTARKLQIAAGVLELIHIGSLIVDDIEDNSQMRRGMPAMHIRYGLPIALNAGNWLYFWPLQLVKDLDLSVETTLAAYECYHRTLLKAHFGQAMDVGAQVDRLRQEEVAEVCLASLTLKTGALTGFATVMGGLIAGARGPATAVLDAFGRELGVALQMFDDVGNLTGAREPTKRYEDLTARRPCWAWACAAMHSSPKEYARFVDAIKLLPATTALDAWIDQHELIRIGRQDAQRELDQAFVKLKRGLRALELAWSKDAFEELRALGEELALAYA